jgi:phosphoserine aminotransferase
MIDNCCIDFTAGPAGLPLEVMEQAQREMLNWRGTGMGVMEMSHRSKEFISIADNTKALVRELL